MRLPPVPFIAAISFSVAALAWAGAVDSGSEGWNRWRQARDQELKHVLTSYLSVLDHASLKAGDSLYIPLGGPRGQVGLRKEAPGKPMVSLSAKENRLDVLVSSTGESLDLMDVQEGWKTPDGMILTAAKSGADYQLVLRDPQKEGFRDFKGAHYFPFNPKAVIHAQLKPLARPERATVMTTQERPRQIWLMGTLEFSFDGSKTLLKAYCLGEEPSLKALFIPFLDATNGIESFVGGRYVEAEAEPSGAVTIDFNRSYNPYCARNHIFSCIKVSGKPIEARILAGEMTPQPR